ncbi:MAG: nicotinate-nucleotide adenylyltransferase [Bacillota bacterium]|nr:nicotinate-nucleotide adenylyltransferase [Bacillota bacterium]
MKKIGVYGGTFDPVHNGHVSLAIDAVDMVSLDAVIFMPVYIQPFKQGKKLADGTDRLRMLELAAEDHPVLAVSDYEMKSESVSYTYKTLRMLKGVYEEEDKIFFLCGTDSFLKIETWMNAEELLDSYSYIVGTRPGYKEEELKETIERIRREHGTEIVKIKNRQVDVSSTLIRERAAGGLSVTGLVPEKVERYIVENGLYK